MGSEMCIRDRSWETTPSNGGAGLAASVVHWIGTVGIGTMERVDEPPKGEAILDWCVFRAVEIGRETGGGVSSKWSTR